MGIDINIAQKIAVWILPLLFAITLHEVAHGWVANKLGDPTAKMLGRITLNPLKHIDPIGTIVVPVVMLLLSGFSFAFGWAKPVPITEQNLSKPRRDMALVAVAGPLANFAMALLWAGLYKIGFLLDPRTSDIGMFLVLSGQIGIVINLILMLLNLLPLPPLDGGRVLTSLLPPRISDRIAKVEPYGFIIIVALLVTGILGYILFPPLLFLQKLIAMLFGLP